MINFFYHLIIMNGLKIGKIILYHTITHSNFAELQLGFDKMAPNLAEVSFCIGEIVVIVITCMVYDKPRCPTRIRKNPLSKRQKN